MIDPVSIRRSMRSAVKIFALTLALSVPAFTPASASAESATEFLKSIEGNYTGRGKAQVLGGKLDTVACKINSSFNSGKLNVSGECASTKGKGKVNGGITANGDRLSGTFVSPRPNVKITQSSGRMNGGKLVLSATMLDDKAGGITKVQQIISKTGSGLRAEFFLYDNASKSYKPAGNMTLKKQ